MQHLRTATLNILTRFMAKCPQTTRKPLSAFVQQTMSFSSLWGCGVSASAPPLLGARTPALVPACGFKVKGRLRRRCKDCYYVVRQERLYVICPTFPRHKQMAMKRKPHNTWLLTHATQGKQRAW